MNKIVKENQDRGCFRDGPRCSKKNSVKSREKGRRWVIFKNFVQKYVLLLKFTENWKTEIGILEKLQSFKLFVGTYITFLKGHDAGFPKNLKNSKKGLL
jgi:hypothetical protein